MVMAVTPRVQMKVGQIPQMVKITAMRRHIAHNTANVEPLTARKNRAKAT